MDSKENLDFNPQVLISDWLRAANKYWTKPEEGQQEQPQEQPKEKKTRRREAPGSIPESTQSFMKAFSAISTAMGDPQVINAALRGTSILPDIASRLMQSGMQAFLTFQKQLPEKAGKLGVGPDPYALDTIVQDSLKAWTTLYEEELQRYFHIPQLGLNRLYQERINKAIDKYTIFVTSLTEFLQILQMPFEKTSKEMNEKIEEMAREGTLPEDSREYYRMWVKILEGHFMKLFHSSDYTEAMGNAMAAFEDYLGARNSIIQDMLQSLPIPTNREMNDLYKEIYLLKKKVRELEKASGKV